MSDYYIPGRPYSLTVDGKRHLGICTREGFDYYCDESGRIQHTDEASFLVEVKVNGPVHVLDLTELKDVQVSNLAQDLREFGWGVLADQIQPPPPVGWHEVVSCPPRDRMENLGVRAMWFNGTGWLTCRPTAGAPARDGMVGWRSIRYLGTGDDDL